MKQVWIIDDDPSIRWVLEKALTQAEIPVHSFTEADSALRALGREQPEAIVTDLRMPGLDGLAFLREVQSRWPKLPVIVMTAHSDLDNAVAAFQSGAFEYLPKPFDMDEAVALVRRALGSQAEPSAAGVEESDPAEMIGEAPAMQEVFRAIGRLSRSQINVLITGESGAGKELVASALHRHSPRAHGPFIAINTAAIPAELLESELFGHEKGAFTGAVSTKLGLLEAANGGTVFLDEVGEMPIPMQIKLLRVIQERTLLRVGGVAPVSINVRLIAATNRDIEKMIAAGEFRQDLFYRLKVVMINIPPLRKRPEDIPLLVEHFVTLITTQFGKPMVPEISKDFIDALSSYTFPGNVRELQNIVERAVALSHEPVLTGKDLPPDIFFAGIQPPVPEKNSSHLKALEHEHITEVYRSTGFNQTETARLLGISRTTLWRRLKELNLFSEK